MPRRPARPIICWNSETVSTRWPSSVRLMTLESTTVRAGMLMPAARVSVANTTLMSARWKRRSIRYLRGGRRPAWWGATPKGKRSSHFLVAWEASIPGVCLTAASTMWMIRCRSSWVVS
ncbi:hypothetical protein D3C87_1612450 [compost metagenome]